MRAEIIKNRFKQPFSRFQIDNSQGVLHQEWFHEAGLDELIWSAKRALYLLQDHRLGAICLHNQDLKGPWIELSHWWVDTWLPQLMPLDQVSMAYVGPSNSLSRLLSNYQHGVYNKSRLVFKSFPEMRKAETWLSQYGRTEPFATSTQENVSSKSLQILHI